MAPINGNDNQTKYNGYNFEQGFCEDLAQGSAELSSSIDSSSDDVIPDKDPELLQYDDFAMTDHVTTRSEATWQSKLFSDPSDHLQLPQFANQREEKEFQLSLQLMALGQVYQESGFDKLNTYYQKVGGFSLLAENPKRLDLISEMVETSFKLYENNPSEANLHKVFYVLKQFNLDPKYLKDRILWNKRMIAEARDVTGSEGKKIVTASEAKQSRLLHPNGLAMTNEERASLAKAELPLLEKLLEQISGDLSTLVSKSNAKDPVAALAHKSTVELLSGDRMAAIISLKELRSLVQKNPPKDQKEIAEYVTYLHRLVDLQKGVDLSHVDPSVLKEAQTYLAKLPKNNLVKVSLILENLELKDAVHQKQLAADLQTEKITQSEYASQINKVREEIQCYSHTILESKDLPKESKAYVLESALKNAGRIYDNTLNMALIFHQSEEEDKAAEYVKLAEATHMMEVSGLSNLGLAKQDSRIQNSLGRKDLSLAHYKFRTGEIEESIQILQEIVTEYPESEVASIILSKSYWPAEFGIVKEGQFTKKLSDPSYLEALKSTAAKFNEKKGRAFQACGLGVATYVVADIALGEKATGLGLAVACGSAFLIERGFLVTENAHEIVESYEYAVSRHTSEEALKGAGSFALDMGLLFLGGAAGSVAKTAYMTQMSRLAPRFAEALVSVGIKPGPWTRQAGAFLLEESGNVIMSSVMHATTLEGTRAVYALQGEEVQVQHKAEDYLKTWLMVRLFMGVNQASPANSMIKDIHATSIRGRAAGLSGNELNQFVLERISLTDKAAAFGINTTIASALTQLSYSMAEDDFDKFSDKVAQMSVEMLFIHLGQKPFAGLSAKQAEVMKGYFAEAEANYARARKIIEEAPDHNNNGPWNNGLEFAFAGANNASPESEKTKDPKHDGIFLMSEDNLQNQKWGGDGLNPYRAAAQNKTDGSESAMIAEASRLVTKFGKRLWPTPTIATGPNAKTVLNLINYLEKKMSRDNPEMYQVLPKDGDQRIHTLLLWKEAGYQKSHGDLFMADQGPQKEIERTFSSLKELERFCYEMTGTIPSGNSNSPLKGVEILSLMKKLETGQLTSEEFLRLPYQGIEIRQVFEAEMKRRLEVPQELGFDPAQTQAASSELTVYQTWKDSTMYLAQLQSLHTGLRMQGRSESEYHLGKGELIIIHDAMKNCIDAQKSPAENMMALTRYFLDSPSLSLKRWALDLQAGPGSRSERLERALKSFKENHYDLGSGAKKVLEDYVQGYQSMRQEKGPEDRRPIHEMNAAGRASRDAHPASSVERAKDKRTNSTQKTLYDVEQYHNHRSWKNAIESQRRNPPGSIHDTKMGEGNLEEIKRFFDLMKEHQRPIDPKEFGLDLRYGSIHNPDGDAVFLNASEILAMETPVSEHLQSNNGIAYGVTQDGRHLIQQIGMRGCTAASAGMLILDHGKNVDPYQIKRRNMGRQNFVVDDLRTAGLTPLVKNQSFMTPDVALLYLARELAKDGSAVVSVSTSIGGHSIVVDKIDSKQGFAEIRDPFHGWSVRISLRTMSKMIGKGVQMVQVAEKR